MNKQGAFIGEVARQTGLSVHTIRYYETERLLPEAPRTESGYRVYATENVEDLKFIRKAQELGFSLAEIRELLVLRSRSTGASCHVKALIEERLKSVRAKRRELEMMERDLRRSLVECQRQLTRQHPDKGHPCPVLRKLGRKG